ncbi:hypothetical protein ACE1AT_07390 [Pelatocladus sp. BLCC-F211]|uniref:hypothetical protein n=1 Tax=Pelatocladus sp. BLCC-F211 TaxID=3342752 RepID=UPI0035BB8ACB
MTQGAPDAIQVADRFHLLKNVTEVLQQVLEMQGKVLRLAHSPPDLTDLNRLEDVEECWHQFAFSTILRRYLNKHFNTCFGCIFIQSSGSNHILTLL